MSLLFFWRCEGTTLDGTHDFTAGDTSATANGSATISNSGPLIGSNSILTAGSASHFRIDSGSIIAAAEGSLSLSFRIGTWVANGTLFTIFGTSTDNFIQVMMTGTDELRFQIGSATGPTDISLDTTAANIALDTTYRLIIRWQDSTNSRYIGVFNSSDALISETEDTTTNWVVPTELSGGDRARFGDTGGAASAFRLDNIAIADDYAEPLEDNFQITSYTEYGGGAGAPSIVDVDGDNTISLEQQNIVTNATDEDTETIEVRLGGHTYLLSGNAASADMPTIGTTGPVDAPHPGSATWALINGDDQEDTQAITITDRSGSDSIEVGTPNADPDLRLDSTADAEDGDWCMWFNVQGGDIGDVTVNDDLTWDAAEGITSFQFQIWDADDGTWGDAATQTVDALDTIPDAFSFTDQLSVSVSAEITSAAITVSGIEAAAAITITGGTYSINGAAFTSDAGTVDNGDEVRARHTSSASYSTATNTAVTIGGVSDTFTSLTGPDPLLATGHGHVASAGGMGRMMGRS